MTIVIPMFFLAAGFGFFAPRMTKRHWTLLCVGIFLIIVYNYVKPPKPLAAPPSGASAGG